MADIQQIIEEAGHGKAACPLVRTLIKKRLAETEKQFQAMPLIALIGINRDTHYLHYL